MKKIINWICRECAFKHCNHKQVKEGHLVTWHAGKCDICEEEKILTEPRDFGHLKENWNE